MMALSLQSSLESYISLFIYGLRGWMQNLKRTLRGIKMNIDILCDLCGSVYTDSEEYKIHKLEHKKTIYEG